MRVGDRYVVTITDYDGIGMYKVGGIVKSWVTKGFFDKLPQYKVGYWIPHPHVENTEWDICSCCGIGCKARNIDVNPDGTKTVTEYNYDFCPHCGADMRRETDD